jgi:hypothetical protein
MKKLYAVLLSIVLFSFTAPAQFTFQKRYGGPGFTECREAIQTTDSGYVLVGSTRAYGHGGKDIYLIKTDKYGDTLWTKAYGGTSDESGYSVKQTFDGGYVIAGSTLSFTSAGSSVYVIKTNSSGDTTWTVSVGYASSQNCVGFYIEQSSDSSYFITGKGASTFSLTLDAMLAHLSPSGSVLLFRAFGTNAQDDETFSSVKRADGRIYTVGIHPETGPPPYSLYVVCFDSTGQYSFERSLYASTRNAGYSVQASGNNLIIGGVSGVPMDASLVKTDDSARVVWRKHFGGTADDGFLCVRNTSDGSYVACGFTSSEGAGDSDVYLVKTDTSGALLWSRAYGGVKADVGYSIRQTYDGGYIIGGTTQSFGADSSAMYLIKTDANGNSGCNQSTPSFIPVSVANNYGTVATSIRSGSTQYPTPAVVSNGGIMNIICTTACTATASVLNNSSCFQSSDGSAYATSSISVPPYTYLWMPTGGNSQTASNLSAGNYTCLVTDSTGCAASAYVTITEPSLLVSTISSSGDASCSSCNDGWAVADAFGGIGPYTYSWSTTPVQTTFSATALLPGNYTVCVTDNHGCSACDTVIITYPTSVNENIPVNGFSIYPNSAHNVLNVECRIKNAELRIYDVSGRIVHQQILTSAYQQINNSLSPGIYLVKVTAGEKVLIKKLVVE